MNNKLQYLLSSKTKKKTILIQNVEQNSQIFDTILDNTVVHKKRYYNNKQCSF
jgi:hypothetical protein